jgi:hypothetical protein
MLRRFKVYGIPFIRRPVSEPPAEGTVCAVDNGHGNGWTNRSGAKFVGGEWKNARGGDLRFVPTYWITIDAEGRRGG